MAISVKIVQLLPRKYTAFSHIKVSLTASLSSWCQASMCWSKERELGGGDRLFVVLWLFFKKLIGVITSSCTWLVKALSLVAQLCRKNMCLLWQQGLSYFQLLLVGHHEPLPCSPSSCAWPCGRRGGG